MLNECVCVCVCMCDALTKEEWWWCWDITVCKIWRMALALIDVPCSPYPLTVTECISLEILSVGDEQNEPRTKKNICELERFPMWYARLPRSRSFIRANNQCSLLFLCLVLYNFYLFYSVYFLVEVINVISSYLCWI